jgi:hypothetical protein
MGAAQVNWKYHIPHIWDPPTRRMGWAEVWLLPDDPEYRGESVWLTIDALSGGPDFGVEPGEFRRQALEKIGERPFWIRPRGDANARLEAGADCDMLVRAEDFDREEFLKWVELWLRETGLACSGLIEAPYDDFAGSNKQARAIDKIKQSEAGKS